MAVVGSSGELPLRASQAVVSKLEQQGPSDLLGAHLGFMQAVGGPPITIGNEALLLIDGPAAYAAMFRAIANARRYIHLETYILEDDEVGQKLAELLLAKRAQGVEVRLIYDSVGSHGTSPEFFRRLVDGGIAVVEFNPVNPAKGRNWRINNRDHRKLLIVDGDVAFTGGINISSVYSSGSGKGGKRGSGAGSGVGSGKAATGQSAGWRDTQIELRGPVVAEFQRLFLETWGKQHGAALSGPPERYLRVSARQGDKVVQVIASTPDAEDNVLYLSTLSALNHARVSIHLTMAYFVPDPQTVAALVAAARRGVDVKLILAGFSDFWMVFHAGRSHYADLLQAGVLIYERQDAMLHAKTAVIDGVWSTVGSANIDLRSFVHNDEANAVILGEGFGQQMEAMFRQDLARANRVDPAQWARRPPSLRIKEWLARWWEYWL